MRTWIAFSCFFSLTFFCQWMQVAEGRRPRFGHCAVAVDIEEVKKHFEAIKHSVHLQDTSTDVTLLDIRLLNGVQHAERCCFFRELLRFYLDKIFKPLEAANVKIGLEIKSLANSFLSMKLQLKHCRENLICLCGEQSKNMMDIVEENFKKLDEKAATMKAVGEINILIHWIKNNIGNHENP
ncbi:interleukin-20-like [Lissotriton helveticus]